MSVRWSRDDRGLVIHQKGSLITRLFGVPFLAAAGIFAWHLVTGLLGFVVPSQGQLTGAGLVMLPICVLLFGTPGWILVFGRKRTVLDAARRMAIEERDFLIHSFREETAVPRDAVIRAHIEASQGSNRTIVLLLVEIVSKKESPIQIAVFDPKEVVPARELAMEAAGVLGASLVDDIDKGPMAPSHEDEDDDEDEEEAG
ncbi:MAG TPA: hypothetical protein VMV21_01240 [Vicinamibacteria bacterium]|nr:hypothetical protein [Vicinamibacteria bacterium]